MNDPIDDIKNYIWNVFYFNRNDPRIIVPKRARFLGWTVNFARRECYWLLLVLFLFCFYLGTQ
ncbi:hypothetical protein FAM09_16875 [Niastella caeni]|uniref:DUF5808 domain-containing protein n=1 Tax=Niastella caeni TaxID=2569763 RepID=A0A4S8HUM6_9BACT|nr:hypothetical protein FAM09_16875 [Niastella caeni]